MTADELARLFHETYEDLAPEYGYETRPESRFPWADVPKNNKMLMTEVARVILLRMAVVPPGDND